MFELTGGPAHILAARQTATDVVLQSGGTNGLIIGSVGFLAGLVITFTGIQRYRKGRLVADTATERARSVAVGQTELEGTAEPLDESFRQPFRDGECLYAEWSVEEYRQVDDGQLGANPLEEGPLDSGPLGAGPVGDTSLGSDGGEWETVGSDSYAVPFLVTDDTGAVVVDPESDSDVTWRLTDECTTQWTFGAGDIPQAESETFAPRESLDTETSERRRYTQTVLPSGADVYVFGQAVPTDHDELPGHDLKIERDTATDRFIVSNMGEEDLRSFYTLRAPLYVLAGVALCAVSLYVALSMAA